MLRLRHWIKDFFGFSRSQVNGFIILLPLVTILLFSEPLWHWWISSRAIDFTADQVMLDSLIENWETQKIKSSEAPQSIQKRSYFAFDPNAISTENFIALGFSQPVSSRITRYRQKGGKFRIKSDLLKIYGLDSSFYVQLYPFITLPEQIEKFALKEKFKKIPLTPKKDKKEVEKFDLNQADTAQLKTIYGIGEKLSLRIIKYRDRLGGFVSLNQLKEVYGLDSAVIYRLTTASFLDEKFQPVKININTALEKQLAAHPYLTKAARAIVAYRFQHGEFKAVEDIRNTGTLDENAVQRMLPYLQVKDD